MQNIANPKKIDFKTTANDNSGIITIEPLFPGYGMTLGNSLRRVLYRLFRERRLLVSKLRALVMNSWLFPVLRKMF